MRIVIADDESLARSYLSSLIEDLRMDIEIVGKAKNGMELVNMVKELHPDIAFVDIKMPKLSGLEAIGIINTSCPQTQCVILSGHSEFENAKEAIKLGVSHYLLKPVMVDELRETFIELTRKNRELSIALNNEFENEMNALFYEISSYQNESEDSIIINLQFYCSVFVFDSNLDEKSKADHQLELTRILREKICEPASISNRMALFILPNGNLALLGAWRLGGLAGKHATLKIMKSAEQIAQKLTSNNFYITVLQSDICSSFETLQKRLNQLQNMAALRVICQNQYLTVKELARVYEGSISDVLKLCDLLISLASAYQDKEYLTYMKTLNDIEKIFSKTYISLDEDKKKSILSFIMRTVSCKIKPEDKPAIWLKQLHKAGEVLLLEAQKLDSSSSDLVNKVILFIEQNYADEISLGQIAENLNITASYLSNLFHRTTNTTFLKYLTKYRMLKAKELLTKSSNQVKQVAEQVGYYSTRHFTKLFKEFYGCYPSELLASELDTKGE